MQSTIIRRRTTRLAVRSPDIDGFLPKSDVEMLYTRWDDDSWGKPLMLHGNIPSITCDQVKEVGFQDLSKVYGVRRAKRLIDAAARGAL